MVGSPCMSNFVLEKASQPSEAETVRGRNRDDDVSSFAAALTNLRAATRASVGCDDNNVATTTRTESPQTPRKELAKVRSLVTGAVVERKGGSETHTPCGEHASLLR